MQLLDLASDMFEISASDLVLRDGAVTSRDGTLHHEITEVTTKLGNASLVGHGSRGPNPDDMRIHTFGCQVAQIAVDTLTGNLTVERVWAVHDVGRIINPMGAMSQVTGGILQAVGFALSEERVVDPTTGTVVNPGFEDYKVPTMADTPEIVCEFVDRARPPPRTRREGPRRASHHPHRRGDRKRLCPRDRGAAAPGAVHPAAGARRARGAGPVRTFTYSRPESAAAAAERLSAPGARAMGGGTDLLTQLQRRIRPADEVVDLRGAGLEGIEVAGEGLRIGAATRIADVARHPDVTARFEVLAQAAAAIGSPQLREMGTVAGNLCQAVRCWYYRHPDLTCWLRGGDTCYAQVGDHRKHGLEPGDCISVAPSDLAAALLALDATVATNRREIFPLAELYRKASADDRSTLTLEPGELITAVTVPQAPDASAYVRAGERAAWSFALCGVAAARVSGRTRLAAIGVSNLPRLLDPDDPLAGLPGLEMTAWKRRLLEALTADALASLA